jgi:hypothetical protein
LGFTRKDRTEKRLLLFTGFVAERSIGFIKAARLKATGSLNQRAGRTWGCRLGYITFLLTIVGRIHDTSIRAKSYEIGRHGELIWGDFTGVGLSNRVHDPGTVEEDLA